MTVLHSIGSVPFYWPSAIPNLLYGRGAHAHFIVRAQKLFLFLLLQLDFTLGLLTENEITYFLSSVLVFSAPDNFYYFHNAVFSICFVRLFPKVPRWTPFFFIINMDLEAATLSLLPILQSFYEILLGSHADRANKESVLQRSWAARCAPASITQ